MADNAAAKEFNHLNAALEHLGAQVLDQLCALERGAAERGGDALHAVLEKERAIDALELDFDRLARSFLELRTPLGPDFRRVLASLDVARNLERIGDCAAHVARSLLAMPTLPDVFPRGYGVLEAMIMASREILDLAQGSWRRSDAHLAGRIPARDDVVDDLYAEMHGLAAEAVRRGDVDAELGIKSVLVANKLEAMADVASHIAEAVYFVLQARQIRHQRQAPSSHRLRT